MTPIPRSTAQLYETDFVAWTEKTVQLIRAGQFEKNDKSELLLSGKSGNKRF